MNDRDESIVLNELNSLILELASLRGVGEEGDVLSDWILVADVNNFDDREKDSYCTLTMRGSTPNHIAFGLLHEGYQRLNGNRNGEE